MQRALAGRGNPQAAAASITAPWTAQLKRRGNVIGGKAPRRPGLEASCSRSGRRSR